MLHARCDDVMRRLAARLGVAVPPYVRRDAVMLGHQQQSTSVSSGLTELEIEAAGGAAAVEAATDAAVPRAAGADDAKQESGSSGAPRGSAAGSSDSSSSSEEGGGGGRDVAVPFSVFVQSSHGPKCPLPMVQSVDFVFEVRLGIGLWLGAVGRSWKAWISPQLQQLHSLCFGQSG